MKKKKHENKTKETLQKKFLFFGRNSNIHGLRFIVQENEHPISRIFWLLIVVGSGGCLYLLLLSIVAHNEHISFTPDTLYLDWTTMFPAVTICELYTDYGYKDALDKFQRLYPELFKSANYDLKKRLTSVLFNEGRCNKRGLCAPCGDGVPCDLAWRNISERIRMKCEALVWECSYNGRGFPCCRHFVAVDSAKGPCFALNSMHTNIPKEAKSFVVNRTTGPGILKFKANTITMYVHSPEELATQYLDPKLSYNVFERVRRVDFVVAVAEMGNDAALYHEDIHSRQCRYPDEVPRSFIHSYKAYSYGACRLASDTEMLYNHCGCVHPVRDLRYNEKFCNYTGINCLDTYKTQMEEMDTEDTCLPSCVEMELKLINIEETLRETGDDSDTVVTIRMASLPTLRYVRHLLRTNLDLVVSIGGLAGLFFGASILSVVETFYLILRKPS
ncbi:unnamed protein product [Plutella xylostella]|uniref:(diamondback moth) hypothetical protein n=1 Tax=Plutella xylostella TaxID=51655 RepID=A0A8S4DZ79_PLUXY|nr:unnamed protein product [Plutella xylostella]